MCCFRMENGNEINQIKKSTGSGSVLSPPMCWNVLGKTLNPTFTPHAWHCKKKKKKEKESNALLCRLQMCKKMCCASLCVNGKHIIKLLVKPQQG